ncbi:hypothetical protein ACXDF8_17030 [Mycolicibacterium sp. CBM1]
MTAVITTRPLSDSTDSLLRFAMRLDATITGVLGLGIATTADPLSRLSGLSAVQEYAVGAAFVLYGLVVYALAAAPELRRVGTALALFNVVGTVGFVAAATAGVLPLTAFGVLATLASALYCAAFAAVQYLGLRRLRT